MPSSTGRRRRRRGALRIAVLDEHFLDHIPSSMELRRVRLQGRDGSVIGASGSYRT